MNWHKDRSRNPDAKVSPDLGDLAAIPPSKEGGVHAIDHRFVVHGRPQSLAAEQFRVLYTKLMRRTADQPSYVLAVSSALKEEGKTFTAMNLAMTMAGDFHHSVLLIEADVKRPSFHTYFKAGQEFGLTDVLEGKVQAEACWSSLCEGRLRVLSAGRSVDHASRVLASPALVTLVREMQTQFKFIILDTPPILPLADMNLFTQWVDGILLVVRAGKTPRSMVKRAIASLATEKIIGTVLNRSHTAFSRIYYRDYIK